MTRALAVSLLLHLLALFGQRIDLSPPPDLVRIEAKLVRTAPELKPAEAPPPPSQPKPKPKKPRPEPKPAPPQELAQAQLPEPPSREAPPPEPEPPAAPEDKPAANPAPPPPTEAVAGSRWPRSGRIEFAIYMGEQRFQMGQSIHQWEVSEDNRYKISALSEPTGLAVIPWFKPDKKLWVSTGRITESGLQPESFVERMEAKMTEIRADLDWEAKQIKINGGLHVFPLPEGTQDLLSFFYQLGYPGAAEPGTLPVTTGRKLEAYQFEKVGEVDLALPFGMTWHTLHVRAKYGNESTEVWLARDYFGLPVQIRTTDRKGVVYYLIATKVMVAKDAVDGTNP